MTKRGRKKVISSKWYLDFPDAFATNIAELTFKARFGPEPDKDDEPFKRFYLVDSRSSFDPRIEEESMRIIDHGYRALTRGDEHNTDSCSGFHQDRFGTAPTRIYYNVEEPAPEPPSAALVAKARRSKQHEQLQAREQCIKSFEKRRKRELVRWRNLP